MPQPDAATREPAGTLRVTGYAALHVLLFAPVLALFLLTVIGGVLAIVWIGVLLLMGLLPGVRALADLHRSMASRILGEPVPALYLPLPHGPLARLRVQLTDMMTWRDLLWMLWAVTVGFAVSLVVVLLMAGVVTLPIWWYAAVPLMRARASVDRSILSLGKTEQLAERVQVLTESRAGLVDHSAAELRRIERDLHDGPQARMAAVALNLGLAADLLDSDPQTARRLLGEARTTSSAALADLRDVVRGIHPPVLADRGLDGAVRALALDVALPVELDLDVPERLPAPVESAAYFTVAECLANVVKHADATRITVRLAHSGGVLRGEVGDDGRGGAHRAAGGGLDGIAARLSAFDGSLSVSSPPGGPTLVRWEVPCASSSPRITRSSARA